MKVSSLYRINIHSKEQISCWKYIFQDIDEDIVSPTHIFDLDTSEGLVSGVDLSDLNTFNENLITRNGLFELKPNTNIKPNTLIEVVSPVGHVIKEISFTPSEIGFKLLYELYKGNPRLRYLFYLNESAAYQINHKDNINFQIKGLLRPDTNKLLNSIVEDELNIQDYERFVLSDVKAGDTENSKVEKDFTFKDYAKDHFIPLLEKIANRKPKTSNEVRNLIEKEFPMLIIDEHENFRKSNGTYNVAAICRVFSKIVESDTGFPNDQTNYRNLVDKYIGKKALKN